MNTLWWCYKWNSGSMGPLVNKQHTASGCCHHMLGCYPRTVHQPCISTVLTIVLTALAAGISVIMLLQLHTPAAGSGHQRHSSVLTLWAASSVHRNSSSSSSSHKQQGGVAKQEDHSLQLAPDFVPLVQQQQRTWHWYLTHPPQACVKQQAPKQQRMTASPLISGDTLRSFADHVFDETSKGRAWDPEHVQQGDVIFVKTDCLGQFFQTRHPQISNIYILITHNSDYHAPWDCRKAYWWFPCKTYNYTRYLSDPQLGHWYAQNLVIEHPKATHVPIGLANWYTGAGDVDLVVDIALKAPEWDARTTSVYVNMSPRTNKKRAAIIQTAKQMPGAKIVTERITWVEYLHDVAQAKFVVAPPGNGVDTHRAWEAIYLGAVPIVLSGPLNPLFKGMRVMVVDSYGEVTQERLESFAAAEKRGTLHTHRAWAIYWLQRIEATRRRVQSLQ